jgi:molybdopterin-binding protein
VRRTLKVDGGGSMKLSARNVLSGKVVEIERGSVNAVVKVDIGGGKVISSMITLDALKDLGVSEGSDVFAIIKSSNVIIGVE